MSNKQTANVRAFIKANELEPVVSGAAFAEGGGSYTLRNGRSFRFTLAEAQSMPSPTWTFDQPDYRA